MSTRSLFPTLFYEDTLANDALVAELEEACRDLAQEDRAGVRWSREHGYRGYTSYASLNDLPHRDPPTSPALPRLAGFNLAGGG
jgi:hypothetical protein